MTTLVSPDPRPTRAIPERQLILLLSAVQFINILDFVIVMPLGPFFARDLGFSQDRLGLVAGSYTLAAAVSGLVSSRFLDRFDRRNALVVAMLGLVVGTLLGGFASGLPSLLAARLIAGAFGGPASSLSMSIVADAVPVERRGKALGTLMGAFAVAQVLGVPIGLRLAQLGSWRTPFLALAALGVPVVVGAYLALPPLVMHLAVAAARAGEPRRAEVPMWRRGTVLVSWTMMGLLMMGNFALIPFISPFVLNNRHYPPQHLERLYLVGGAVNFIAMRLVGRLTDRVGEVLVGTLGTALFVMVVAVGFLLELSSVPVMALFIGFMLAMAFRAVPISTLTSKVPAPFERAEFMSSQSAIQHFASSMGAIIASRLVHASLPNQPLSGVPRVAMMTIALALCGPPLLHVIARRVRAARPG